MKTDIKLLPDERIVFEVEADFWGRGNNPLMKLIGNIQRVFAKILGYKVRGKLVVTNQRAFEFREEIACWCIPTNRGVKVLTKRGIQEIGYSMTKFCGLFCPTYSLYYEGETDATEFAIQNGSDEKLMDLVNKFYDVIK